MTEIGKTKKKQRNNTVDAPATILLPARGLQVFIEVTLT